MVIPHLPYGIYLPRQQSGHNCCFHFTQLLCLDLDHTHNQKYNSFKKMFLCFCFVFFCFNSFYTLMVSFKILLRISPVFKKKKKISHDFFHQHSQGVESPWLGSVPGWLWVCYGTQAEQNSFFQLHCICCHWWSSSVWWKCSSRSHQSLYKHQRNKTKGKSTIIFSLSFFHIQQHVLQIVFFFFF